MRIIDTNHLVGIWKLRVPSVGQATRLIVLRAADELIRNLGTAFIVTPVRLEFIAGARSAGELELFDAFLTRFRDLDEGEVTIADWNEAMRLARRVPRDGKPRHLGDCLIRAIANRLNADVITSDAGFPG